MKADVETKQVAAGDVSPAASFEQTFTGIAILGSHPGTKSKAPFDDPKWLIYACSPDNTPYGIGKEKSALPRVDVWFELHRPIADRTRPYRYLRLLEDLDCPIIMRDGDALPAFPKAVAYPDKKLKERFGPFAFSNSVAYMIAKAIVDCEDMHIPRIGLWGIMQGVQGVDKQGRWVITENEYYRHRVGTQQMLWEAHKAGLNVDLPEEAAHLFAHPIEDW